MATYTGAPHRAALSQGALLLYAPVEVNLSDRAAFEPTSLAPDVWYGVTQALSVGLIHSTYGTTGLCGFGGRHILSGQGAGVCFTGQDGDCRRIQGVHH